MNILKRLPAGLLVFLLVLLFQAAGVHAQSGLSITLTPPLFQLTIGPGEMWTSSLKIVNNNNRDVDYYAQVVDMEANGETGESKFIPLVGPQDPALSSSQLARWIALETTPITVKAGRSANLRFTVKVPANAEPGGHYAAILVGTQPLAASSTGSQMSVSSFISSLMFVRIKGDVTENSRIREFTSDKDLYQTPKADFVLRVENTGNTHIKPEGAVTIYNMWGKKRGEILVNHESGFGNVLPQTVRRFEFSWEGEENVFDIGRYSAEVTLAYGEEGRKNISATTYFWVVPLVPVSITLGAIVLTLLLLGWFIRRYIRRALQLERARYDAFQASTPSSNEVRRVPILETIVEPLRESVVDLRALRNSGRVTLSETEVSEQTSEIPKEVLSFSQFMWKYRLFFAFIAVAVVCLVGAWLYFTKVLVPERTFNIQNVTSESEGLSE